MYKIVVNNNVIGFCDTPRYIMKKSTTGSFISCKKDKAEGIAFKGNSYNLLGKNKALGESIPEAALIEVDGGEFLVSKIQQSVDKTNDVLCELDQNIETIKDALCELDLKVNGGK